MQNDKNIFDKISDGIRGTESSIVNFLSAIAPWGAPSPAAYMSYQHMVDFLHFPGPIAIIVAVVIEILGFSTVSTAMAFRTHNSRTVNGKDKAPLWVVVVAFGFYLSIVLVMNVIVDANVDTPNEKLALIVVRALLTLMSIPAALVMAVRTQYYELINAISLDKQIELDRIEQERAEAQRILDNQIEQERIIREEERLEREQIRQERREARQARLGFGNFGRTSVTEANRSPSKKSLAMNFISQYVAQYGQFPKHEDVMQAAGIALSTASQFRGEWAKANENNHSEPEEQEAA